MKSLVEFIIEAKREKVEGNGYTAWIYDKHNYNAEQLEKLTKEVKDYAELSNDITWNVDTDAIYADIKDSKISNKLDKNRYSCGYRNKPRNEFEEILGKYHNVFPNKSQISISFKKI